MATKAYTGVDGAFNFVDTGDQARVTAWSVESSTNVLDKSEIGDVAVTNVVGLKSYTGTASLVYYSNDPGITKILDKIIKTGESQTATARFIWGARKVAFNAIISGATITAAAGEIVTAEVSFVADGDLEEVDLTS
jgi:hypothetical protein